jgi:hypothetical protein
MEEIYLIFKIVVLIGAGAAMDRAWLASKKMWSNRIGREVLDSDTTKYETAPLEATLNETGEQVITLQVLPDSNITGVDDDGKVNKSDLTFHNNKINENDFSSNPIIGSNVDSGI